MKIFLRFIVAVTVLFSAGITSGRAAQSLPEMIDALSTGKIKDRAGQVEALLKTKDPRLVPVFQALTEGTLYYNRKSGKVYQVKEQGDTTVLLDPLSGAATQEAFSKKTYKKVKVNNKLRRMLRGAMAELTLFSPDEALRFTAAQALGKGANPDNYELVAKALAEETSKDVRQALVIAGASMVLKGASQEEDVILAAIQSLKDEGTQEALGALNSFEAKAEGAQKQAALAAITKIEKNIAFWNSLQNVWYGLSLGSVLLLAAIGLAITFGVMGVINMAHGEMVMLGAYTTYVVQELIRTFYPEAFNYSLALALPLAFLVAGAVGLIMERGIIRFLYGRPLETLLATWGVSLVLQQSVRSIFGPTNKEVGNPDWMSGAFELGGLSLTANRLWIMAFSLVVFAVLLFVLRRSFFGLKMRAVTQNRAMASSMGIRTPWVDAFTFALGSGIAGMAGVALSQISNVSPNLGQTYIIDSFMVVVFGGVGNLWGTLVGAFTLGVANKFLEPYSGAVLAKILTLVFIVLFIQKRPRGLFAQKGRAVEQ
ncbi:urea ABC transporter permease subunit UrtB [Flexibacterium corallicola]|uniref:urea ABC transporter permease subunit UrtB n=1 Tax=Flexibacterium corallicola TaxID=3037259 RepID=UPI003862103A